MSPTLQRRHKSSPATAEQAQRRADVMDGRRDHLGLNICLDCGARMTDHFGQRGQFVAVGTSIRRCH
jgi:hypothetical protein